MTDISVGNVFMNIIQVFEKLTLRTLCKRSVRDIQFLDRFIHNAIESPALVSSVYFSVPLKTNSRNLRVFHPVLTRDASPVLRIQQVINAQFTHIAIFSRKLSFVK